jgi:hypothetical protein
VAAAVALLAAPLMVARILHVHVALHVTKVSPPHPPLFAVSSDWSGQYVVAVGARGTVAFRATPPDERWLLAAPPVDADLYAVAQGDGPAPGRLSVWEIVGPPHCRGVRGGGARDSARVSGGLLFRLRTQPQQAA